MNAGRAIRIRQKPLVMVPVVGLLSLCAAAAAARPDPAHHHRTWETFDGRCTRVVVMDALADPTTCYNKMTTVRLSKGAIGLAFTLNPQGGVKPWIMSFLASQSSHGHINRNKDNGSLSIQRVYLTIDGHTDDFDASGSCSVQDTSRSDTFTFVCSASTPKGNFAGEFTGNHSRAQDGEHHDPRQAAR